MKKHTIILLAIASVFVASCDRVLTLSPESQLTPDAYFKTAEDLQLFSNTFYNNLLDKTPYEKEKRPHRPGFGRRLVVHQPAQDEYPSCQYQQLQ